MVGRSAPAQAGPKRSHPPTLQGHSSNGLNVSQHPPNPDEGIGLTEMEKKEEDYEECVCTSAESLTC